MYVYVYMYVWCLLETSVSRRATIDHGVEGVLLGGTPDLVLESQSLDGKRHLKLVDFKSAAAMKEEYETTNDCMLRYVSLQVSFYALMLETMFHDVVVTECFVKTMARASLG